jgi:hypothetical protein
VWKVVVLVERVRLAVVDYTLVLVDYTLVVVDYTLAVVGLHKLHPFLLHCISMPF